MRRLGNDLGEVALVPVNRVFDRTAPAQHPGRPAVNGDAVPTRWTDGIVRPELQCLRHVARPRDDRPFAGWRIRHLQKCPDNGDRLTSDIHQGRQAVGFDEPIPGAAAEIAIQISLQTSPHHRAHSGVEGTTTVLNQVSTVYGE